MIDIAAGVLTRDNQICLSLRQKHQSHADHWEFPGGKIETGETVQQALVREFEEELAIETSDWQPLIEIPWHYEKVSVRLHVYQTEHFSGEPHGNEGQLVQWFDLEEINQLTFPEANQGIIKALNLPGSYMISGSFKDQEDALQKLNQSIDSGVSFCQLRAKDLAQPEFIELAQQAIGLAHSKQTKILLNADVDCLESLPLADGIQLASNKIYQFQKRPIAKDKLLGVSTHTVEDIQQALKIDADFLLLSPVKETSSHPGVAGIGWQRFAEMVKDIPIPVYALGGMKVEYIKEAKLHGAQGIAAISGLWK